jgi:hypothetical protein
MNDIITHFNNEFEKLSSDDQEFIKDNITITDNRILIHFDSIKWYDSYPHIMFFNDFWKYAKGFDADGINGEHIIIGEELSDIEEYSFGDNLQWILSLNRYISINTGE